VGGIHFDARLVQHCLSEFRRRHGIDLGGDPRAMARLRAACERAKRALSVASRATITLDELAGVQKFEITIARSEFEEMCEDLLQRCTEAVDRVGVLEGKPELQHDSTISSSTGINFQVTCVTAHVKLPATCCAGS
jgi:molecular chaperone DnaK (HSP70)